MKTWLTRPLVPERYAAAVRSAVLHLAIFWTVRSLWLIAERWIKSDSRRSSFRLTVGDELVAEITLDTDDPVRLAETTRSFIHLTEVFGRSARVTLGEGQPVPRPEATAPSTEDTDPAGVDQLSPEDAATLADGIRTPDFRPPSGASGWVVPKTPLVPPGIGVDVPGEDTATLFNDDAPPPPAVQRYLERDRWTGA